MVAAKDLTFAPFEIIPVEVDDIKSLARIYVDCFWENYKGILSKDYLYSLKYSDVQQTWERKIPRRPTEGGTLVFHAPDGDVVGFIDYGPAREHEHGIPGEIYDFYILKKYQKSGMGQKLFEAVIKDFKNRGYDCFYLCTFKDNPSKGFFIKNGGKVLKESPFEFNGEIYQEEYFYFEI
ncbi:GNAT family N-acetyltransferase [Halobacteriovorax sp. GFR7]|uniref:GNAT family N-acetyltransferase n=1 Tax=unclassified Halobacteriovorax TaxID=2639665 RepID=UPI003721E70C